MPEVNAAQNQANHEDELVVRISELISHSNESKTFVCIDTDIEEI